MTSTCIEFVYGISLTQTLQTQIQTHISTVDGTFQIFNNNNILNWILVKRKQTNE